MARGPLVFAIVFVLLPLLLLGAALLAPAYAVALAFTALLLLTLGFTVGVALVPG